MELVDILTWKYEKAIELQPNITLAELALEDDPITALEALLNLKASYLLGPQSTKIENHINSIDEAIDAVIARNPNLKTQIDYLIMLFNTAFELYQAYEEGDEILTELNNLSINYNAFKLAIRWAEEKGKGKDKEKLAKDMGETLQKLVMNPVLELAKEFHHLKLDKFLRQFDAKDRAEIVAKATAQLEDDEAIKLLNNVAGAISDLATIEEENEEDLSSEHDFTPTYRLVAMDHASVDPLLNPPAKETEAEKPAVAVQPTIATAESSTDEQDTNQQSLPTLTKTPRPADATPRKTNVRESVANAITNLFFGFAIFPKKAEKTGAQEAAERHNEATLTVVDREKE
jgi:hypothetical protein